jgi:hypothetical protein
MASGCPDSRYNFPLHTEELALKTFYNRPDRYSALCGFKPALLKHHKGLVPDCISETSALAKHANKSTQGYLAPEAKRTPEATTDRPYITTPFISSGKL